MRTTLLVGEYPLTVDEKNRLLIPSEIRRQLDEESDGKAFFVVVGINRKIWFYPEIGYKNLVSKLESDMSPDDDKLAFDQLTFAMARWAEWDKQGRLLLPEAARKRTELGRDVIMLGVRDHLELWNADEWAAHSEALLSNMGQIVSARRKSQDATKAIAVSVPSQG